jgi:hypothetical protein
MPSENTITTKNAGSEASADVGQQLSNVSMEVKTKASDLGRMAADKVDENRDAAAAGLESAADTIHDKADSLPGGKAARRVAHVTADKLSATADYIREHDVDSMMSDLYRLVKNNPGPALLGAAVVGFLVARSFSDD